MSESRSTEAHFEIATDNGATKWAWVLYGAGRKAIAASPKTYKRKPDVIAAVKNVQASANGAKIMLAEKRGDNVPEPDDDDQTVDDSETVTLEPGEIGTNKT